MLAVGSNGHVLSEQLLKVSVSDLGDRLFGVRGALAVGSLPLALGIRHQSSVLSEPAQRDRHRHRRQAVEASLRPS
jgi:hypothetical protein